MSRMKVMIAGLGSIGRRHFRNLHALGVHDLVLLRKNLSTLPDDELAGFPVETDIVSALEKHKPDAVVVANPSATHLEIAIPAAKAGCAILLEKPISHTMDGVEELQQAATTNGARILVGFQFRFHPTLQKAREIIMGGGIGKVLSVHSHWGEYLPNWHPWEDYRQSYAARQDLGGGVVVTLSHPIDYLRFLIGEMADTQSLHGRISPLQLSGVEDCAEIAVQFANGAIGGIHLNYFQRPPAHRLEVVGTQGTLRWDNADGTLTHWTMPDSFGVISAEPGAPLVTKHELPAGFDRNDLFLAQTRHFMDVAAGTAQPLCSLEDGVQALRIALQVRAGNLSGF